MSVQDLRNHSLSPRQTPESELPPSLLDDNISESEQRCSNHSSIAEETSELNDDELTLETNKVEEHASLCNSNEEESMETSDQLEESSNHSMELSVDAIQQPLDAVENSEEKTTPQIIIENIQEETGSVNEMNESIRIMELESSLPSSSMNENPEQSDLENLESTEIPAINASSDSFDVIESDSNDSDDLNTESTEVYERSTEVWTSLDPSVKIEEIEAGAELILVEHLNADVTMNVENSTEQTTAASLDMTEVDTTALNVEDSDIAVLDVTPGEQTGLATTEMLDDERANTEMLEEEQANGGSESSNESEMKCSSADALWKFLVESVNNKEALENFEQIKSTDFELLNEDLSSLDLRLSESYRQFNLPADWSLLGNISAGVDRETLLHFCACLGLTELTKHLSGHHSYHSCLLVRNKSGLLPYQVANNRRYTELSTSLTPDTVNKIGYDNEDIEESSDQEVADITSHAAIPQSAFSSLLLSENMDQSPINHSLEAEFDKLHQLIAEIESDCISNSPKTVTPNKTENDGPEKATASDKIETASTGLLESVQPTLTSIPEGETLKDTTDSAPRQTAVEQRTLSRLSDQSPNSDDQEVSRITDNSIPEIVTRHEVDTIPKEENCSSGDEDETDRADLIMPYSETSSGSDDEPPALPPRQAIKNSGRRPVTIATDSVYTGGNTSVPSITVSPPRKAVLGEAIDLVRCTREQVEAMQQNAYAHDMMDRADLKRFSTSCPHLEELFESNAQPTYPQFTRHTKGQYKSLLDVTHEENEEEVRAAISESPRLSKRLANERPRSLDCSAYANRLSIAGVTSETSSTDQISEFGEDPETAAERNRRVSFNMFGGGAQREKSKFHQGIVSAESRSFSLGSLGSEDDEEGNSNVENPETETGHVKPIDIYGPPLQKLPNVDFSKPMNQFNSLSSSSSNSSEKIDKSSSGSRLPYSRSGLPVPSTQTTSNLSKSRSVSTPSINQIGKETNTKRDVVNNRFSNTRPGTLADRKHSQRPFSEETHGPSYHDDDDKKKKGRRTSVFAKFGSVRSSKSKKDKAESKKTVHNFIAVSVSNSICNYCNKLISRSAVQCSYCITNFHDECKDRVPYCTRQKDARDRKPPSSLLLRSSSTREKSSSFSSLQSILSPHGREKMPVVHSLSSMPSRNDHQDTISTPSFGDSAHSNSMDSLLIDDGNPDDEFEEDQELIAPPEPESWSETADKKTIKSLKAKYIQRQDNIWELIATEKQYLLNLKIMYKIFVNGFRQKCAIPESDIQQIFPELTELLDIHEQFLAALQARQNKRPDKIVECIGDLVKDQFSGATGERMKKSYGAFCSRHKEATARYKDLLRTNKHLQMFIKKTHNLTCTKRRGVPDLITVVTMRMTKYKTILENIIKNTKESKDKPDRENLSKGLELNIQILVHIDHSIHLRNQELKQLEIFAKIDARSTATYDKTKKFSKSSIMQNNRKLKYEGTLMWRNARDKEVEILAVVLSDVVIFLQESDKKYTFFSQDNKASVIPLQSLIVREKGSTKDNKGIYLIRQSRENPEMYELVCKSSQDRRDWIHQLRKAVAESPEEDEGVIPESEEEHKEIIAKLTRIREYVELLEHKDKDLVKFCEDRRNILRELMTVYDHHDIFLDVKSCYDEDGELKSAATLIRFALEEAGKLASTYETSPSTNIGRSWSSVGERHSAQYQHLLLPKRADTFNGFDQDVKSPVGAQKTILQKSDSQESNKTPSLSNLHQDSDSEITDSHLKTETNKRAVQRTSSNILQNLLPSASPAQTNDDTDSGRDSLITLSYFSQITNIIPPTREQAVSISQVSECLHGILLVTNRQESLLERSKSELSDIKSRFRKMESEQESKTKLRHNKQMEEIRNRHEQLTEERRRLEAEKDALKLKSTQQANEMDAMRTQIEQEQAELRREKGEIQRQKLALQKQIDFYKMGGQRSDRSSLSPGITPAGSSNNLEEGSDATSLDESVGTHSRSRSAELVDNPAELFIDQRYAASLTEPLDMKEVRAQNMKSLSPERQISPLAAGQKNSTSQTAKKSDNNNTVQTSKILPSQPSKTNKPAVKNQLPLNLSEPRKSRDSTKAYTPGGSKSDIIYF